MDKTARRTRHTTAPTGPIPWSEWAVACLGLVLVGATVGYLAWLAVTAPARPPDLVVAVESIVPAAGGHQVRVRVTNRGGSTAAEARVEGALEQDGTVETSEVQFDYVPQGSDRVGTLVFQGDPRTATLLVRIVAFREP